MTPPARGLLRRAYRPLALVTLSLVPLACGEPPSPSDPLEPADRDVAALNLTPSDSVILEGETITLTAVARNAAGAVIEDPPIEWAALGPVAVSPGGVAHGLSLGVGLVVATSGTVADTAAIRVLVRFQSVSAGAAHTCAVSAAGHAYCWGGNREGRLGTGERAPVATPTRVVARNSFRQLSAGWELTCGIVGDGAACWGSNRSGQLGSESKSDALTPVWVIDAGRFVQVATHTTHSCAVAGRHREVWCWGAGSTGQRGTGSLGPGPPQPVAGDLRFRTVDVGWQFSCGVTDDGGAWCWGTNREGQLGRDSAPEVCPTNDREPHPCALTPVPVASTLAFDTVTAGTYHACALAADGTGHCWGRNAAGQLGNGSTTIAMAPTPVSAPVPFRMLTAGDRHTCAVDVEGAAWCWGDNTTGALGTDGASSTVPVRVNTALRFRWLAAARGEGGAHTCGLATDDLVYCWGDNELGQLGTGQMDAGGAGLRVVKGQN